jgi:hypothetical protein
MILFNLDMKGIAVSEVVCLPERKHQGVTCII